jgi:hypothetical protein
MCAPDRGRPHADPDHLDHFAHELDELAATLTHLRTQLANLASRTLLTRESHAPDTRVQRS